MTTAAAPASPPQLAPKRPATAKLRYLPESARPARALVREKLLEWGLDGLVDPAELIISELVSNALKTGCHTFMVVAIRRPTREGCVRISVRDGSRTLPVLLTAGPGEECHRGLALVEALSSEWGATLDTHGKTVHADLLVD